MGKYADKENPQRRKKVTDVTVYPRHMRAAKLCMPGVRRWFAAHNLDWSDFVANGILGSVLGQWNDPLAERAIEQARQESTFNGG